MEYICTKNSPGEIARAALFLARLLSVISENFVDIDRTPVDINNQTLILVVKENCKQLSIYNQKCGEHSVA